MDDQMFCYQCQETAANRGCNRVGMCGKKPEVAALQDLLLHAAKSLSCVTVRLRKDGESVPREADKAILAALCATSTNVNFDADDLARRVEDTLRLRDTLLGSLREEQRSKLPETAFFIAAKEEYLEKAATVGVLATEDEDVRSLRALVAGGLKGLAAFLARAEALGAENEELNDFVQRALIDLQNDGMTGGNLLSLAMETGRFAMKAMEQLDAAKREAFGKPEVVRVRCDAGERPGILVAGDDFAVLREVLVQSEGKGVDVYTHGELLSAHAYPGLHKFEHLVGQYGGSWWQQKEDFEKFGGPVVIAGDALVPPREASLPQIFTTGETAAPGLVHIEADADGAHDFSAVIEQAKASPAPAKCGGGELITGYDCENVFALAEPMAAAIQDESLKHFVILAGADGRAKTRSYYTDFAKMVPEDAVILTAGSVIERFRDVEFGKIGELPRLLVAGQMADAYSLIQIAMKLDEAVVIDGAKKLPILYNFAWYDQKSLAVLLTLFYLDIKNVYLGPTMPAFVTPTVAGILTKYFGVAATGTAEHDAERLFGKTEAQIRGDMIVSEIVNTYPQLVPTMLGEGLHCISCGVSEMETLDEACRVHGLDTADILELLNDTLAHGA